MSIRQDMPASSEGLVDRSHGWTSGASIVEGSAGLRLVTASGRDTSTTISVVGLDGPGQTELGTFAHAPGMAPHVSTLRLPSGDWVLLAGHLGDVPGTASIGRAVPVLLNIVTGMRIELPNLPHSQGVPRPMARVSRRGAHPASRQTARLRAMPRLPAPTRLTARRPRAAATRPTVVVLGDLVIDVVLAPARPLERGTDVAGLVRLRQGGSATTTARWLGRLGARSSLVCAIGRDPIGRALVRAVDGDGVQVRAVRVAGAPTGRIGVLVEADGERSFVQDRGAALRLRPEDLKPEWFTGADCVHLPAYSLLDQPLGLAGMAAIRLAREAGALVTIDLSSTAPLLAKGRRAATALVEAASPDLLFATRDEARALAGSRKEEDVLLAMAPIAVIKRGRKGATILVRDGKHARRFELATTPIKATDTTGAGDAFSAGFLFGWLDARQRGLTPVAALQRGAVAGNRAALRHLSAPLAELPLG